MGDCPDDGACHHGCTEGCFRVFCCGPLSGVYPDDTWPDEIRTRFKRRYVESVPVLTQGNRPTEAASAAAFAAIRAVETGEWDRFLTRFAAAVRLRQSTDEYKQTLIAGGT